MMPREGIWEFDVYAVVAGIHRYAISLAAGDHTTTFDNILPETLIDNASIGLAFRRRFHG